jgi:hypothetical protein
VPATRLPDGSRRALTPPAIALAAILCGVGVRPLWAARTIAIGRISISGPRVERSLDGREWKALADGDVLRTGDQVRCDAASTASFDIGWARLVLGPDSLLAIPASTALSLRLETGRLEQLSEGSDIVKMRTAEALLTGKGHIVVWRQGTVTSVSARLGRFRVDAAGSSVRLEPGFGTAVAKGRAPLPPRPLAAPPDRLVPAGDPVYAERRAPIHLEWASQAPRHHVELLAVGSDLVVEQIAAGPSPANVVIPWPGTYRWRVAARDDDGIEGQPSRSGLICVLDW